MVDVMLWYMEVIWSRCVTDSITPALTLEITWRYENKTTQVSSGSFLTRLTHFLNTFVINEPSEETFADL